MIPCEIFCSVVIQKISTNDVDELFSWDADGWDTQYLQLTKGGLGFSSTHVDLDGVLVQFYDFAQGMRLRECRERSGFCFTMVLDAEDEILWGTTPIGDTACLYQKGKEAEHLAKGAFRGLVFFSGSNSAISLT